METPIPARRRLVTPRRILSAVLVAVVVVFLVQNADDATVQLLMVDITGPLWLILLAMFFLGAAVAWLLTDRRARRRSG